ncbi:MAG: hypothetical protein P4L83_02000, partial [Nevskia sp.]|nr:hypothetical protein [Nevskia sp.]
MAELKNATQTQAYASSSAVAAPDVTGASGPTITYQADSVFTATTGAAYPYTKWDGDKIQACVCDGDFFGPDCSLRNCPKGDDPLTTCTEVPLGAGVYNHQIQQLTLTSKNGAGGSLLGGTTLLGGLTGELVLQFTDNTGEVWTTTRIGDSITGGTHNLFSSTGSDGATLIQNALTAIPNFKIPKVTVSSVAGTATTAAWQITFDNERNSGNQVLLACEALPLGCQTAGCSPLYQQPKSWSVRQLTNAAGTYATISNAGWVTGWTAGGGAGAAGWDIQSDSGASPAAIVLAPGEPATWTATLTAIMNAFITPDSILDNSGGAWDQADVRVTIFKFGGNTATTAWGAAVNDVYATYQVEWDFTGTGAFGATTCTAGVPAAGQPFGCTQYVPTGFAPLSGTTYGTGVGYNHVPIGYGIYINLPDAGTAGAGRTAGLVTSG